MRIYFHLMNGHETIRDDIGIEVSCLKAAEAQAQQAIEDTRDEALQAGETWQGWRLEVVDPAGTVLLSIPLDPILH